LQDQVPRLIFVTANAGLKLACMPGKI